MTISYKKAYIYFLWTQCHYPDELRGYQPMIFISRPRFFTPVGLVTVAGPTDRIKT